MDKNKNEELQSRREFFKSAAKAALPVLGAVVLSSLPINETLAATGCTFGCTNGCSGGCGSGCGFGCQGGCKGQCQGGCKGQCQSNCIHFMSA